MTVCRSALGPLCQEEKEELLPKENLPAFGLKVHQDPSTRDATQSRPRSHPTGTPPSSYHTPPPPDDTASRRIPTSNPSDARRHRAEHPYGRLTRRNFLPLQPAGATPRPAT